MDQLDAHRRAQEVFAGVLANVKPAQLDDGCPCTEWNVKTLINHVVGGNQWVAQLAGQELVLLPDDIAAAHEASAEQAQAVFSAPDGLSRMFELPFATIPGAAFAGLRASDVFTHAWDLAKATGQSTDLDHELAGEALGTASALISPAFRGPGRPFGEEQPCPAGRPPADQLAAYLGRVVD
jgi:uncharacterized protein (TIGR03086 family)